ncbi:formyltetrahydrofolate deformylase [Leucobacter japonicus]|uniref:formyltetrahydrofolate deformylase n=1 Tax=Leucobacter japonicus TaxID=1461259 RepID=UPI0006A79DB7|nr:formyltetrahydrofolate deformylase [Leucobacter japonicus]
MERFILRLSAADQPGIIHAVSGGIAAAGGNILESAQFADDGSGLFSVRIEFETASSREHAREGILSRVSIFDPLVQLRSVQDHRRMLVMVSQLDHCLDDLLYRYRRGELPVEIPVVVSNHELLRERVEREGIPFAYIPVTSETKQEAETQLTELAQQHRVDFIVLARYMQILSDGFCAQYSGRIINIHHSFLPSFKGAKPYHQAHRRGVKLIGATAHYVTADLDEGPIIEQDVARVNHRQSADELVVLGRDVERSVLARAVRLHAEDRVFLTGQHTVVLV